MLKINQHYKIERNVLDTELTKVYIFDSHLNIKGRRIISSGIDTNEDLAFKKMISETCERFCMLTLGINSSSGMASHSNLDLSIKNSKLEVYERNFLKKLASNHSISPSIIRYKNNSECFGFITPENLCFVLYKLKYHYSYAYGVGISEDFSISMKKAYLEALLMNDSFKKYQVKGAAFHINKNFMNPNKVNFISKVCFMDEKRYVTGINDVK